MSVTVKACTRGSIQEAKGSVTSSLFIENYCSFVEMTMKNALNRRERLPRQTQSRGRQEQAEKDRRSRSARREQNND